MPYESLESRILTFSSHKWPHSSPDFFASPLSLAGAGFYLSPTSDSPDRTVCHSCGLALVRWEAVDDPVVEHRLHAPQCTYMSKLGIRDSTGLVNVLLKDMAELPEQTLQLVIRELDKEHQQVKRKRKSKEKEKEVWGFDRVVKEQKERKEVAVRDKAMELSEFHGVDDEEKERVCRALVVHQVLLSTMK